MAVSDFLDVDGVFALTLQGMFLVEGAGVEPLDLDLASLANYGGDDLGGEGEHAVDLRLGSQALLRAQDGDAALAEANVLSLEANHRSAGEELAQLAGIGHVDAEAVGRPGAADLDEDLLRRLAVLARSDQLDVAFVLGLDLDQTRLGLPDDVGGLLGVFDLEARPCSSTREAERLDVVAGAERHDVFIRSEGRRDDLHPHPTNFVVRAERQGGLAVEKPRDSERISADARGSDAGVFDGGGVLAVASLQQDHACLGLGELKLLGILFTETEREDGAVALLATRGDDKDEAEEE